MHYVGTRASQTNPLRSVPLFRPAASVFGPTLRHKIETRLFIARRDIGRAGEYLPIAYSTLGRANAMKHMRLHWQAKAFRQINQTRAELRAARKALVAAEAALLGGIYPLLAAEQSQMPPSSASKAPCLMTCSWTG